MATKKRAARKPASKSVKKKAPTIVDPPKPFPKCIDRCYENLKTCLAKNPKNAQMCLRKFQACVVGCIGPVFRP